MVTFGLQIPIQLEKQRKEKEAGVQYVSIKMKGIRAI